MANDVKINCYAFQIRERNKKDKPVKYDPIKDILIDEGEKVKSIDFRDFFSNFMVSFDNKFKGYVKNNQAIYLPSESINLASERRIIYGFFRGGSTGSAKSVHPSEDPDDEVFSLKPDHVISIEQFFLIWFPEDLNMGLLMIQGYSNETSSETFKRLFQRYFSEVVSERILDVRNHFPTSTVDNMQNNGTIDVLKLTKHHLPPALANEMLGTTFINSELTVEIMIKGLTPYSESLKKLTKGDVVGLIKDAYLGKPRFFTTPDMEDVGMDGTHDVSFVFEAGGKRSTAKQSKGFKLSPYYYVDRDDFPIDPVTNLPTKESIQEYCLAFFETIKTEMSPNTE